MSMTGGTVTIDDEEAVSGGGMARAIYDGLAASNAADLEAITSSMTGSPDFDGWKEEVQNKVEQEEKTARLALRRQWAKQANALGPAIVAYIQAEARVSLIDVKATVSTSTSTGRLPASLTPGDAIDAPSAAVDLPVTGDGGATEIGVE